MVLAGYSFSGVNDLDNVSNFINDKSLIILTTVVSSLTTLILVFLFKSFALKFKLASTRFKAYVKKMYRWHKGRLTTREFMELERRKEKGESLTKREQKLLLAWREKWKRAMSDSKIQEILKEVRIPDLSKINFRDRF